MNQPNDDNIHISFIKKSYDKLIVSAMVHDYSVQIHGLKESCSCSEKSNCTHLFSLKNHLAHYLDAYLDHYIKPYAIGDFLFSSLSFPDNKKKLPLEKLTFYSLDQKKFFFQPKKFFKENFMVKIEEKNRIDHSHRKLTFVDEYLLDWQLGEFFFLEEDLLNFFLNLSSKNFSFLLENKHPQAIFIFNNERSDEAIKIIPSLEVEIRGSQFFIQKGFFYNKFYPFEEGDLNKKKDIYFFLENKFLFLSLRHLSNFRNLLQPFFIKKNYLLQNEDQLLEILFYCYKKSIPVLFNNVVLKPKNLFSFLNKDSFHHILSSEIPKFNLIDDLSSGFFIHEKDYFLFKIFQNKKSKDLLSSNFENFLELFEEFQDKSSTKLPSLKFSDTHLRDYQREGVDWLIRLVSSNFGGILADDMGLGKTRQIMFFLKNSDFKKVLIIVPMSLLFHWKEEIQKYLKDKTLCFYHGAKRIYNDEYILLTSYQIFRREEKKLSEKNFSLVIFDEIQFLKNESSKTSKLAKHFPGIKIGLTGTPFENHLQELVTLMKICLPFLPIQTKEPFLLKKLVQPFLLRRRRDQVLQDLPLKQEQYVFLEFSSKEQSYYNELNLSLKKFLEEENHPIEILKTFTKLRLACLYQKELSTKVEFLKEQLFSLEDKKILVFSQFTSFLNILEKHFPKSLRLDGTMNQKKREQNVDMFKKSTEHQIFFISLKAGGQGLNLQEASYVFLMDPWWNPAVEDQAIGRSYRLGQKNSVHVFKPIIKGSIEEKVLKMKEDKKFLFQEFLEGFHEGAGLEGFLKELKNTL